MENPTLLLKPRIVLLFALLCAAVASLQIVHAATITVMNTNDSGAGSLRQALADASNGDTINFDSSLNGQAITLTSDALVVLKNLTISGPGANQLTVQRETAGPNFQIFHLGDFATRPSVIISGLTITKGVSPNGGGIFVYGALTLNDCVVHDNQGSGIYNYGSSVTVTKSTVSGNLGYLGGGIYNTGAVTVTNSTVKDNVATDGGGIYNNADLFFSATLTITNSTISGNSADGADGVGGGGGGIYNTAGADGNATVTINNSTVSGNATQFYGGGIYNACQISGTSATLTVANSTISGNSASLGGGIYNLGEPSEGASPRLTISDTILKAGGSGANIANDSGTVISLGYNLSSDAAGGDGTTGPSGFLNATGDIRNTDPLLDVLADNGGPTFTHALMTSSPAIDAGDPNFTPPPNYDQRGPGYPRVGNGRIDIGAFEVQATAYAAQIQQPINADGTSVFSVRRGVVPVKFTLTLNGAPTCDLPAATIAMYRTGTGGNQSIDESVYTGPADTGSNFRIDSCQYVYNLSTSALGVGTYEVDILINGQVVGSTTFTLR